MGQSWALNSQAKAFILGPGTGPSATLDPDTFSESEESPHLPCSWPETQREGMGKAPGHNFVTITLDSLPLKNAQTKEQPG